MALFEKTSLQAEQFRLSFNKEKVKPEDLGSLAEHSVTATVKAENITVG